MEQYLDPMRHVREHGMCKDVRTGTGTGTSSVFGCRMRFDPGTGLPVVTTKAIHIRSVVHEFPGFLKGSTNLARLHANGVTTRDERADEQGEPGPIHGAQWRSRGAGSGGSVDRPARVVENIRRDPDSRRHVVSAWNIGEPDRMALPPRHLLSRFHVAQGRLSHRLCRRSAGVFT